MGSSSSRETQISASNQESRGAAAVTAGEYGDGLSSTAAGARVVYRSGLGQPSIPAHALCGYSPNGVPAYSNYQMPSKTITAHYVDGVFMGYKWQCVEYARRWLWLTKGLLLPTRMIAARYKGLKHVYKPIVKDKKTTPTLPRFSSRIADVPDGRKPADQEKIKAQRAWASKTIGWEKVPCVFVYQGTTTPPTVDSLIIYPFTLRNMTGHIGVITAVDLEKGLVGVADQNRYFTPWVTSATTGNLRPSALGSGRVNASADSDQAIGEEPNSVERDEKNNSNNENKEEVGTTDADTLLDNGKSTQVFFSALFRLECVDGRYYIRDPEDECVGWITFPGYQSLPQE